KPKFEFFFPLSPASGERGERLAALALLWCWRVQHNRERRGASGAALSALPSAAPSARDAAMSDTQLPTNETATQRLLPPLDGRKEALAWLETHRHGLAVFARALANGRKALENLRTMSAAEWDHLFELVCDDGLDEAVQDKHPDVHQLFEAVKGDDEALARLQRKRPSYARLVGTIRAFHGQFLLASPDRASGH